MKKIAHVLPILAGIMFVPSMQLYAMDGTKKSNLISDTDNIDLEALASTAKQTMYLTSDASILSSDSSVSSQVDYQLAGTTVTIIEASGDKVKVISQNGNIGYIDSEKLTSNKEYVFVKEDVTFYADSDAELLNVPFDDGDVVETLNENDEVHVVGSNDLTYWKVEKNGNIYYINSDSINAKKKKTSSSTYIQSVSWNGQTLTPSAGTIMGPSGKETYYNLNMSGVVSIMRSSGNTDEYWVRDDGVKMLGNYVMVAANFALHPRGSLVQTSLGMAIVCDTGSFVYSNPTQIDIAVAW